MGSCARLSSAIAGGLVSRIGWSDHQSRPARLAVVT